MWRRQWLRGRSKANRLRLRGRSEGEMLQVVGALGIRQTVFEDSIIKLHGYRDMGGRPKRSSNGNLLVVYGVVIFQYDLVLPLV